MPKYTPKECKADMIKLIKEARDDEHMILLKLDPEEGGFSYMGFQVSDNLAMTMLLAALKKNEVYQEVANVVEDEDIHAVAQLAIDALKAENKA